MKFYENSSVLEFFKFRKICNLISFFYLTILYVLLVLTKTVTLKHDSNIIIVITEDTMTILRETDCIFHL